MIIGTYRYTPSVSSGAASETTQELKGQLLGITVQAATSSTIYTFYITDPDGDFVFIQTGIEHVLVDNTPILLPLGRYTWYIVGSSADEKFVVKLKVLEASAQ